MKITRVEYRLNAKNETGVGLLSLCNVVLDNCLLLAEIKLCRDDNGKYYLLMPSKQDAYADLATLNKKSGKDIILPERRYKANSKKLKWDEYFHPITHDFYAYLSTVIVEGYENKVETGEDYK